MTTPKFAMSDTRKPDGYYVQFKRVDFDDQDAHPKDYLFQEEEYRERDQARLDAWKRDEWRFIGIRAKALLFIVQNGVGVHMTLESPGCWSIESDSDEDYLNSVYGEEIETLKALIAQMASPQFEENKS